MSPLTYSQIITLPDGSIYDGSLANGLLHGEGTLRRSNGDLYTGAFFDGLMSGMGTLEFADGDKYSGEFAAGKFHGTGHLSQSNGHSWKGQFDDGKMVSGKQTLTNNGVLEGSFENWKIQGNGSLSIPDRGVWSGVFDNGQIKGIGQFVNERGDLYKGEFISWSFHGQGELTLKDGSHYQGKFEHNKYNGQGILIRANGDKLIGHFDGGELDAKGRIEYSNGDWYEGQFRRGKYHGQGVLFTAENNLTEEGYWYKGFIVSEEKAQRIIHYGNAAERALYVQNELLATQFDQLLTTDTNNVNLYLLAIAGDGSQGVFKREVDFSSRLFEERYQAKGRTLKLINGAHSATEYPMATVTSIERAFQKLTEVMDVENDILFVFLTSHGSREHRLYLNQLDMGLPDLSAQYLAQIAADSQIKHKIFLISACYSGGFIDYLKNDTTMIIAAANYDKTSFGCSDDADFTYFGRAFFENALSETVDFRQAFHTSFDLVDKWEEEQEFEHSKPQLYAPNGILEKLAVWYPKLKDYKQKKVSQFELAKWWWRETKIVSEVN